MSFRRPSSHAYSWRITRSIALIAILLLTGCRSSSPIVHFGGPTEEELRARELQSLLDKYTRDFYETVVQASAEIIAASSDYEPKLAAIRWRLKTIPRIREINRDQVRQSDALLALWLYTEIMHRHYQEGEGRLEFGANQPIAVAATRGLREQIEQVARQTLGNDEDFERAQQVVEDYARRYMPKRLDEGRVDLASIEAGILDLTQNAGALDWIPTFSLQAINPFSGLNESAAAIRYLTDETNSVIEDVYMGLPWKMEVLLYELENLQMVQDSREDMTRFSQSAATIAASVDRLPEDMRGLVSSTLDEIDVKQEGLRLTLRQTEDTLARAEGLVSGLSETAEYLSEAGRAWDSTFHTLGLGDEKEAPPADSATDRRPFDILDYRDTAAELRSVAVELRGLVQDVQALTDTEQEDSPLRNIEQAAAAAMAPGRDLVDHAAWRLVQLVGLIFVAAFAYRFLVTRFARRPADSGI